MDRDMTCFGIALQEIQKRIAVHIGKPDVERDRIGPEALGQRHDRGSFAGHDAFEPGLPRHIQ